MTDSRHDQLQTNYQAFEKLLPSLLPQNAGKFALMQDGKIIEFFDTPRDAYVAGQKLFGEAGLFSVQEVVEAPVDLGFFSHAVPQQ